MSEQPKDSGTVNETDSDPDVMNPRDLRDVEARDEAAEGSDEPGTDGDPETMNPRAE